MRKKGNTRFTSNTFDTKLKMVGLCFNSQILKPHLNCWELDPNSESQKNPKTNLSINQNVNNNSIHKCNIDGGNACTLFNYHIYRLKRLFNFKRNSSLSSAPATSLSNECFFSSLPSLLISTSLKLPGRLLECLSSNDYALGVSPWLPISEELLHHLLRVKMIWRRRRPSRSSISNCLPPCLCQKTKKFICEEEMNRLS